MIGLLLNAKTKVEAAKANGVTRLSRRKINRIRACYGRIIAEGVAANPDVVGRKRNVYEKKSFNLVTRMQRDRDDILRFVTDFAVGFDNNQAERDIRMVKLQQKISGCWRKRGGCQEVCVRGEKLP
jgi:transposase